MKALEELAAVRKDFYEMANEGEASSAHTFRIYGWFTYNAYRW